MKWVAEHWNELMNIFGSAVVLITLIVKFTETDKDDSVWAKILKVLSLLSLVNPDGSKLTIWLFLRHQTTRPLQASLCSRESLGVAHRPPCPACLPPSPTPTGRQLPEPLPGHLLWVWVPQRVSWSILGGMGPLEAVQVSSRREPLPGFNLAAFKMTSFLSEPAASLLTTPRGQELGLGAVLNPRAWHTAQLCAG